MGRIFVAKLSIAAVAMLALGYPGEIASDTTTPDFPSSVPVLPWLVEKTPKTSARRTTVTTRNRLCSDAGSLSGEVPIVKVTGGSRGRFCAAGRGVWWGGHPHPVPDSSRRLSFGLDRFTMRAAEPSRSSQLTGTTGTGKWTRRFAARP